jgi:hypothetical protein
MAKSVKVKITRNSYKYVSKTKSTQRSVPKQSKKK